MKRPDLIDVHMGYATLDEYRQARRFNDLRFLWVIRHSPSYQQREDG